MSDAWQTLAVRRDGDLLWVTLDAADRANALSPAMVEELTALYRRPWRDDGVRAILLTGAGRHFSAGADLAHLESLAGADPARHRAESARLEALFAALLWQDALTLALVNGSCIAGGCGLATACDFVVAATDARFLYSEVRIGFVAALVATFLPLRVRGSDLRELLLAPQLLDAESARAIGLVNRVVAPAELQTAGRALAVEILERASSESLARTKRLLLDVVGRPLEEALRRAAEVNAESRSTEDCRRGVAHFLAHKRAPTWR